MFIKKLKVFQFRNLSAGEYHFPERVSFVVGKNGQGKSNLIEAISFLSSSRSFRTSVAKDLVRWGSEACSVFATVEKTTGSCEIGMSIESGRRKAFVNGEKSSSLNNFIGELVSVVFSPADLALVQSGPIFRRQFIDKHLVDINPQLFPFLMSYQKTLQHRNMLLKKGEREREMYDALSQLLIESAEHIQRQKRPFVVALERKTNNYYQKLSASGDGEISVRLVSNTPTERDDYRKALAESFAKDSLTQSTSVGPHRDDLEIFIAGKHARAFASQGQARSIAISLKLAVLELIEETRQDAPLLLLDDIESELDSSRMEQLLSMLFLKERQVILTGTDLASRALFEEHSYQVLSISNGSINTLK